jgi:hypothetical protein
VGLQAVFLEIEILLNKEENVLPRMREAETTIMEKPKQTIEIINQTHNKQFS